ncbi:translation initiation factor IF-2-like [Xenopus laevis]|uniref:Translation initiation factor IF-2-like n=2 Tax=Xenopus laevis TaxID=8355 RepID=A0A1L8FWA3_XENLA|nr:translation initiation factor IF-2-like [Xenopus laevis]OCT75855.1 hypothetical protein XELAEV_18031042mg [Xenopus laevis]
MPQTLPMVSYVYDMYGMAYPVVNQAYPAPAMSLQDEHFMQTAHMPEQNYNAVNSELQNPSVRSITESGQPEFCQEFVENKSPPKPDITATSVTSMPLSTEEPIMQSPKLSDDTKANAVSEKKAKKGTKRKPKSFSSVSDETKKRKRKTVDPTDDTKANAVSEKETKTATKRKPKSVNSVSEETKKRKRKTDDPTDDTKANAVSETKSEKGTKRKPKSVSSVSDETKKRKRKTDVDDDPVDQTFAKKHCRELQQKMLESINTFHALGKKPIVTSQLQHIREPEEKAQLQRPKPSSPKRGQVKAHINLPKVKCEGVKKRSAPSLSKIEQNIQAETPIQKSPPQSEDMWEELLNQLEFSIPLPPEEREALKRKAQQEREEACQYTAKGRVRYFDQWQSDMDISLQYGYLPYLVHK